jgi:hypothetical protein
MRTTAKVSTVAALLLAFGSLALATPMIDSAVVNQRIFNDDPDSVLTVVNNYPTYISLLDEQLDGDGAGGEFANLHTFRLSSNSGISEAVFSNGDAFEFFADVTVTTNNNAEAGLNVSPWWSQQVDGRLQIRASDGEVAAFGGRLPFYSFTADQGITYTAGTTVRLGVIYNPNSLSETDPATIEYFYNDGTQYTSGPLAFDEGNPAEDPPYGLWGMLNNARVGGFGQFLIDPGNTDTFGQAEFENMRFVPEPASMVLLALAGALIARRR